MIRLPKRKDRFTKAQRSLLMSRIRSKNTSIDLAMKKLLRKAGIPFKMYPKMLGNPDFLISEKAVVFCDSGFWHGRNWTKLKAKLRRGSRSRYWIPHILRNKRRDQAVTKELRKTGYTVLRFWDTDIAKNPGKCLRQIKETLEQ